VTLSVIWMVKYCRYYPDLRCYRSSCTYLDDMGNVRICYLLPKPVGYHLPCRLPVYGHRR